jgi:hypothetical protein
MPVLRVRPQRGFGMDERTYRGGTQFATLSLKIPLELRIRLKVAAARRQQTMTQLLTDLLNGLDDTDGRSRRRDITKTEE